MNRELLETPFRPDQVKHRKGNFGNTLAYVEAHTVIQRLNDALDADWSFEVISHQVLQDEVLVLGRLTVGNISKTQFGNSSITRSKSTGEIISIGDDLKAAATDALKKAATLLGVGIALYAGRQDKPPVPVNGTTQQYYPPQQHNDYPPSPNTNGTQGQPSFNGQPQTTLNDQSQTNNRISSKQLAYLHSLAKEKAITKQELNQMAVQRFNTQVDFLNRKDASLFIEELTNTKPRQYAA